MKVTCVSCKKKIEKADAFFITSSKGRNQYFCSEKCKSKFIIRRNKTKQERMPKAASFEDYQNDSELFERIREFIGRATDSMIEKGLQKMPEGTSDLAILQYLNSNELKLKRIFLQKEFHGQNHKCNYLFAILSRDIYPFIENENKKRREKRKELADEDIIIPKTYKEWNPPGRHGGLSCRIAEALHQCHLEEYEDAELWI